MKKYVFFIMVLFFCIKSVYADSVLTIKIQNVIVNDGTIYVSVFYSEQGFKNKKADMVFPIDPTNSIIHHKLTLAKGEYGISIHQDVNGNEEMDYGLFGIPKEPYGFSNMKGKVPPKNFDTLKIIMDNSNKEIVIPFVSF
ncbi:MAG: DUF2141 domain-containing protein [Treponema sp.]|nr:DUF2141 domain-containing protein [Treponema sp.]